MNLTDAQKVAIADHDHNLIVIAGAGSGKTFVLVQRYLALLEANPDWRLNQLVAITFTKKAAAEMRDRVRGALAKHAENGDPVWAARLAAMDSARIDTIHGLCASILRANAAEAGLDPAFDVLDETAARLLLDDVIDQVLTRLVKSGHPALVLLREYDEKTVRGELVRMIAADIDLPESDVFDSWSEAWERAITASVQWFVRRVQSSAYGTWIGEIPFEDKRADVWRACGDVIIQIQHTENRQEQLELLRSLTGTQVINFVGGKKALWGGEERFTATKTALNEVKAIATSCIKGLTDQLSDHDRHSAELIPHWHTLLTQTRAAYETAKTDRRTLDFNDLERLTADLLDGETVRARYAAEFKHLLVDEFQDTNAAQWRIVKALANPTQPGSLFVVGDPKQSIYAFRGADVSVFENVRREIVNAGGIPVDLNCSFRTHQRLVDGCNALFARLLTRDEHSPVSAYEIAFDTLMEAQRETAPSDSPSLELILLDKQHVKDADDETKMREWEAYEIAARVQALVETEIPVYDKHNNAIRSAGYGDVALLFQAMTGAPIYEAAFKATGVPYQTIAGRGYYDRQEVWDMLNLLRAIHRPADALALASALRSPLFNLSDDALFALRLDESISLWDVLGQVDHVPVDERDLAAFARATLLDLRALAGRVPIPDLLRAALDATGYLAVLTGLPDGARRRGNVEKLIDKARTAGALTLGAFYAYLDDLSTREAREGEAALDASDAVKLMTVHASKGLEFPIVVLVDAAYQARGGGSAPTLLRDASVGLACTINDELGNKIKPFAYAYAEALEKQRSTAERRRLLYVAATRAADHLIVSGAVSRDKNGVLKATGWLDWLIDALDLRDLETGEAFTIPYPWGEALIRQPETVASANDAADDDDIDWELTPRDLISPPLIAPIPRSAGQFARSINATSIADVGSAHHAEKPEDRAFYTLRLRRRVLHEAPARIPPTQRKQSARGALTGEIVHEALRWIDWHNPPDDDQLVPLLESYAWSLGFLNDPGVIDNARRWVRRTLSSEIAAWFCSAKRTYRELPFVYTTEKRMIHGVIDLLIERSDGVWVLVDYKTSYASPKASLEVCALHAKRYHLQMGVYAAAVERMLQSPPIVVIYYIRHDQLVTVAGDVWRGAVARLEDQIGTLLTDEVLKEV